MDPIQDYLKMEQEQKIERYRILNPDIEKFHEERAKRRKAKTEAA